MRHKFTQLLSPKVRQDALIHPMFESLNHAEADVIFSLLSYAQLERGDRIFSEGDPGNQCFFILSGQVNVTKDLGDGREQRLATLVSGDTFGEIAIIDRKPRSAGCVVGDAGCELLSLTTDAFERLFSAQNPFAYKVLDQIVIDLSKRLRGATAQLQRAQSATDLAHRDTLSLKAAQILNSSSRSS